MGPYRNDDQETRYQSLVKHIHHHNPDVVCINESMPCFAFAKRLAEDLAMDCCVHLGVAGICIGPFRFPWISEGDAILAKPHLNLQQAGRRRLTGAVLSNSISFNLDDATQALAAYVRLPSGACIVVCCTHWHASLLGDATTKMRLQAMRTKGESTELIQETMRAIDMHTAKRMQEAADTAEFAEYAATVDASSTVALPVIVSGDLNTVDCTPEMNLMQARGYKSAASHAIGACSDEFITWDPRNPNVALQIDAGAERASARGPVEQSLYTAFSSERSLLDHILFKNPTSRKCTQLEVVECKVVLRNEIGTAFPSDHYGLLVDFSIK